MTILLLKSPLTGWCMPLSEVPDPVFAQGMVGKGVAIDPTGNTLYAPCDGVIVPMDGAKHAITIRTDTDYEILMHVGIDTVALSGVGFESLVSVGQRVSAGQPLLKFELDFIARRASSAVTPIILSSESVILRCAQNVAVSVGDFLMEVEQNTPFSSPQQSASLNASMVEIARSFSIAFDHGLHARPAAMVANALRPFDAAITIALRDRTANARSTVALMAMGVKSGDVIEARATGRDAEKALIALESLLGTPVDMVWTAPIMDMPVYEELPPSEHGAPPRPMITGHINAVIASGGVAIGEAAQLFQPEILVNEMGSGHSREAATLRAAIDTVQSHLHTLADVATGESKTVLAAHIELIQDPEFASRADHWLQCGKSASYAWRTALRAVADTLSIGDDARMMERIADLHDLENQVLMVLAGNNLSLKRHLPEHAILIADELLPSQLISLDSRRIAGICMARGGPTSHISIIAAAMGIPALVAAGLAVLDIADGTPLILNADDGHLHVAPTPAELAIAKQNISVRATQQSADIASAQQPSFTHDKVRVKVYANLGALSETSSAVANGAEGCGLLRTEFLFQDRRDAPDENEQANEYQAIAAALGNRLLTIRTLDIGGDKPIPYLPLPREDNPALGLRGLRTSLWQPELLRTQLRAILRVQPSGTCRILLPMVTDIHDVRAVRGLLDELASAMGITILPALGVMIETPASAVLADQLAREIDFLSVGTNDLSQYTLAMDRGHPALASKLDALHPAVLRLIKIAADAGNSHHKEVAVCGSLASDIVAVPILIGLGVHELSVVPALIPRIKRVVRSLDVAACAALAEEALVQTSAAEVRKLSEGWLTRQPTHPFSGA